MSVSYIIKSISLLDNLLNYINWKRVLEHRNNSCRCCKNCEYKPHIVKVCEKGVQFQLFLAMVVKQISVGWKDPGEMLIYSNQPSRSSYYNYFIRVIGHYYYFGNCILMLATIYSNHKKLLYLQIDLMIIASTFSVSFHFKYWLIFCQVLLIDIPAIQKVMTIFKLYVTMVCIRSF